MAQPVQDILMYPSRRLFLFRRMGRNRTCSAVRTRYGLDPLRGVVCCAAVPPFTLPSVKIARLECMRPMPSQNAAQAGAPCGRAAGRGYTPEEDLTAIGRWWANPDSNRDLSGCDQPHLPLCYSPMLPRLFPLRRGGFDIRGCPTTTFNRQLERHLIVPAGALVS